MSYDSPVIKAGCAGGICRIADNNHRESSYIARQTQKPNLHYQSLNSSFGIYQNQRFEWNLFRRGDETVVYINIGLAPAHLAQLKRHGLATCGSSASTTYLKLFDENMVTNHVQLTSGGIIIGGGSQNALAQNSIGTMKQKLRTISRRYNWIHFDIK